MRPTTNVRLRVRRLLRCERGFTLSELVAAMAILGIILSGLMGAFVSATRSEAGLNARFQAQEQARLAMTTLRRELHCASSVVQADGTGATALTTTAVSGITITLGSYCATAGGATTVSWCARGSARPWELWRVTGTNTCPGSGGVRWAEDLTTGTPFSLPASVPAGQHSDLVEVTLPVNTSSSTASVGTYTVTDDIALRNSSRS